MPLVQSTQRPLAQSPDGHCVFATHADAEDHEDDRKEPDETDDCDDNCDVEENLEDALLDVPPHCTVHCVRLSVQNGPASQDILP